MYVFCFISLSYCTVGYVKYFSNFVSCNVHFCTIFLFFTFNVFLLLYVLFSTISCISMESQLSMHNIFGLFQIRICLDFPTVVEVLYNVRQEIFIRICLGFGWPRTKNECFS